MRAVVPGQGIAMVARGLIGPGQPVGGTLARTFAHDSDVASLHLSALRVGPPIGISSGPACLSPLRDLLHDAYGRWEPRVPRCPMSGSAPVCESLRQGYSHSGTFQALS